MTTEEKIAEVERLLREIEEELPTGDEFTIKLPSNHKRWRVEWRHVPDDLRDAARLEYWKSSTTDC